MSNPTNDTPVIKAAEPQNDGAQSQEEKLTRRQKVVNFVKNHKKPAIAVGALVGLVGVAALTGRKEPLPGASVTLELEPPHVSFDAEVVSEDDTQSA